MKCQLLHMHAHAGLSIMTDEVESVCTDNWFTTYHYICKKNLPVNNCV